MSGKNIPRLVVRRTPEIEALLQDIWHLQPDIVDKNKLTIYLSLSALARELKGIPRLSSVVVEANAATTHVTGNQQTEATDIQKPVAEEPISSQKADNVSDDVEWDD